MYSKLLRFAVLASFVSNAAQAVGILYFSEDRNPDGLWALDIATGSATHVGRTEVITGNAALAPSDTPGMLFGFTNDNNDELRGIARIREDGGGISLIGEIGPAGLAYDPGTDRLYGSFETSFFLIDRFHVEPDNAVRFEVLPSSGALLQGLDFGNGGIYGVGPGDSLLHFYDPAASVWSIVGDTGISWVAAGLGFDQISNRLYAKRGGDTYLYSIDPITAQATPIGDTGIFQGGGLAFVVPEPATGVLLSVGILVLAVQRIRCGIGR